MLILAFMPIINMYRLRSVLLLVVVAILLLDISGFAQAMSQHRIYLKGETIIANNNISIWVNAEQQKAKNILPSYFSISIKCRMSKPSNSLKK